MILLVSGCTRTVKKFPEVGALLVPNQGNRCPTDRPWAIDNGAYRGIDWSAFWKLLARCQGRPGCIFAACPDVVGNAKETFRYFVDHWEEIKLWRGFPIAYVLQDGQEDFSPPWNEMDCAFIGGTDRWKLSTAAGESKVWKLYLCFHN